MGAAKMPPAAAAVVHRAMAITMVTQLWSRLWNRNGNPMNGSSDLFPNTYTACPPKPLVINAI